MQKPPLKSFRDLIAWQRAMDLADAARVLAQSLRRSNPALAGQLERAALSIPSNIAEGYARASRKEYLQFLSIALGSLREVESLTLVAQRRLGSNEQTGAVLRLADETGAVLFSLRRSLLPK